MCAALVRDAAVDNPIPVFPLPKIAFIRQNEKWKVCGFCVEVAGGSGFGFDFETVVVWVWGGG